MGRARSRRGRRDACRGRGLRPRARPGGGGRGRRPRGAGLAAGRARRLEAPVPACARARGGHPYPGSARAAEHPQTQRPPPGRPRGDRDAVERCRTSVYRRFSRLPLLWRVFAINAVLLVIATLLLALTPATIHAPIALVEGIDLAVGLVVM